MIDGIPFNRLQALKFKRFTRPLYLGLGFAVALGVSMAATPHSYASGFLDPTSARGFGTSSGSSLMKTDHPGSTCANANNCPLVWFRGKTDIGGAYSTAKSCYYADVSANGSIDISTSDIEGGVKAVGHTVSYCWDGSAWASITSYIDPSSGSNIQASMTGPENVTWIGSVQNEGSSYAGQWTNMTTGSVLYNHAPPTVTLSSSTGSLAAGKPIVFNVTWSGLTSQPQWLYFYPSGRGTGNCSGGCPTYVAIAENTPLGGSGSTASGSLSWSYTYPFSGTYTPSIILSANCGAFQINTSYSSCNLNNVSENLVVSGPQDADLTSNIELHFPPTGTDRVINTPQPYSWRVNAASQCVGSSIDNARIFAGYPSNANISDPGALLAGTSGSGSYTFTHTAEELGANFFPYIQVTCASGTGSTIYNGDTLYKTRAQPLVIVSTTFNRYWTTTWTGGGKGPDYSAASGSGAYLFTDKTQYSRNEPVLTKFYYDTQFTPSKILIYPNMLTSTPITLTGAIITNKTEHNYTLTYATAGQNYPVIEVRSSSYNPSTPSTYRDIWLGGGQIQDPSQYITITNDVFQTTNFSITNTEGIFGLDPSTFAISLPTGSNQFLQDVAGGLSQLIRAGLYVLDFVFTILKNSPIFSTFTDVIHPINGSSYIFPTTLFGYTIPYRPADLTYTVNYASPTSGSKQLEYIARAAVAAIVIMYVFRALF